MNSAEFWEVEKIAAICHEVNRAYCKSIGDDSQVSWEEAPEWQKTSAIDNVSYIINELSEDRSPLPEHSHNQWMKEKTDNGWVWGPIKDAHLKTHPCLIPYRQLPIEQQIKDRLILYVVRAVVEDI